MLIVQKGQDALKVVVTCELDRDLSFDPSHGHLDPSVQSVREGMGYLGQVCRRSSTRSRLQFVRRSKQVQRRASRIASAI